MQPLVERLLQRVQTDVDALGVAGFKAVADPIWLRLLSLIASYPAGEAWVCDLTASFELTEPTISYHLKVLREAGLITGERRGTWVDYRTVPDAMRQLSAV